ncbi:DUF4169 family protein [Sphingomonas sp. S1-29]|uniref:DUF4169 family protein n=1 Tax=Sphingomonas sp. S1-29 TaxID=2991074 RepID=UPI00224071E7|nr:DUF4169 family protein [Sphingomonas sp. S1-29]UZK68757.1 DUF4169 family protein [Sphingomonas sp. S1-29]
MAQVTNLNRFRKARDKAARAAEADANRARFGRTKAQKAAETADAARLATALDGARRDE